MTTVRTLISLAVKKGWNMYQVDVNNASLHGDLNEEVYMALPQGLAVDSSNMVCKWKKSLYGLKQDNRQWYDKLAHSLYSKGYTHSNSDYSLFYKKNGCSLVFVAVYVDNIILTGIDIDEITSLKMFFHDQFRIKNLGRLHYFLVLEILYRENGIIVFQGSLLLTS